MQLPTDLVQRLRRRRKHEKGSRRSVGRSVVRPPAAFTLLELLVVIGVIALLAALVLPVLVRAKMKAAQAVCVGNERQLTLAFLIYSEENGGVMPGPDFRETRMRGGGYWAGPSPAISAGISEGEAIRRVEAGLSLGPLWGTCRAYWTYHCPGDLRFKRSPGDHWAYDSYSKVDGMNGQMWNEASVPSIRKLAAVPRPADAIVFMEEAESRNYNNGTWVIDADIHRWVDPVAVFHNGASSISFADGHVEAHKWRESTTIQVAAMAQQGTGTQFRWPNVPNDRDFAWVEFRYKYRDWPRFLNLP